MLLTLVKIKTARSENANWIVESGSVAATLLSSGEEGNPISNNVGVPADQCGALVPSVHKSAAVWRSSIPADWPEKLLTASDMSECVLFLQQSFWFQGFLNAAPAGMTPVS